MPRRLLRYGKLSFRLVQVHKRCWSIMACTCRRDALAHEWMNAVFALRHSVLWQVGVASIAASSHVPRALAHMTTLHTRKCASTAAAKAPARQRTGRACAERAGAPKTVLWRRSSAGIARDTARVLTQTSRWGSGTVTAAASRGTSASIARLRSSAQVRLLRTSRSAPPTAQPRVPMPPLAADPRTTAARTMVRTRPAPSALWFWRRWQHLHFARSLGWFCDLDKGKERRGSCKPPATGGQVGVLLACACSA